MQTAEKAKRNQANSVKGAFFQPKYKNKTNCNTYSTLQNIFNIAIHIQHCNTIHSGKLFFSTTPQLNSIKLYSYDKNENNKSNANYS